jgi:hypothetical protein
MKPQNSLLCPNTLPPDHHMSHIYSVYISTNYIHLNVIHLFTSTSYKNIITQFTSCFPVSDYLFFSCVSHFPHVCQALSGPSVQNLLLTQLQHLRKQLGLFLPHLFSHIREVCIYICVVKNNKNKRLRHSHKNAAFMKLSDTFL